MEKHAGLTFLRIKIKHLALEPELLKLEMRRVRARAHYKALSTAVQAGQNTAPYEDPWLAIELRNHRLMAIRPAARAAQLAYAFIKGKSYNDIEPTSKWSPQLNPIAELLVKYGEHTDKTVAKEDLITWIEQSGRWKWHKIGLFFRVSQDKAAA